MGKHRAPEGGRPTKLTKDTVEKMCHARKSGCTIEMCCAHAGIHVSTYHEWIGQADKGGLAEKLRLGMRSSLAEMSIAAMAQIDGAADGHEVEGLFVQGDWKAASWKIERADRLLRQLDERPNVAADHEWRRGEWSPYKFAGKADVRERKIDLLAHLEDKLTVTASCQAARVHRWQFKKWCEEEPLFADCAKEAVMVAVQRVEDMMLRGARSLDKDGKVQTTACFGILNAKSPEYGILKAQLYARNNAKFIDQVADELRELLSADAIAELRERLTALVAKASELPPGASIK